MAKETTEVDTGTQPENNTVVNPSAPTGEPQPQTPDQFYGGGDNPPAPEPVEQTPDQFTKLGWTDAARIEDTAARNEADQAEAEKAAAKSK
jgi:hypothetical protein